MNPTAYAVLAELVAIRDLEGDIDDLHEPLTALDLDEYFARCDAAWATARACVARGGERCITG